MAYCTDNILNSKLISEHITWAVLVVLITLINYYEIITMGDVGILLDFYSLLSLKNLKLDGKISLF